MRPPRAPEHTVRALQNPRGRGVPPPDLSGERDGVHSSFIRRLIDEICSTQCRRSACSSAMISACGQWK
jgi:hypothetical protein